MEISRGTVVKARAGRDKDNFFVVLNFDGQYATICDGKRRKLEKPKRKKEKHLSLTCTKVLEEDLSTNRKIRKALSSFNNKS